MTGRYLAWAGRQGVPAPGATACISNVVERLKPLAIGMVAGEAAASGLFILIILLAKALGWAISSEPQFMPR